jgi:hypothetical protein
VPVALALLLLAAMRPQIRRIKRLSRLPAYEPAFNPLAMRLLRRQGALVASLLRPGERVLETFTLRGSQSWHVLTNQRLLSFAASLFAHRLAVAHELGDVVAVSDASGGAAPKTRWRRASDDATWLEVTFDAHRPLAGVLASPVLSQRLAVRIGALAAARRPLRVPHRVASIARQQAGRVTRRRAHAVASFLLPGLGHWLQRRGSAAIVFFVAWVATVLFVSGPMLWTLVEPFTTVSLRLALVVGAWHLTLSALAAADAWRGNIAKAS